MGRIDRKMHFLDAHEERVSDLCDLSVIIPIWNERENVRELAKRIYSAVDGLGIDYEILYIDDGSTDGTRDILEELDREYACLRVIFLTRNFGQHPATLAGLKYARGKVMITMDADLQNDPADIPKFLNELEKGYDLVAGYRKERKANFIMRRIPSMAANYIFKKMTKVTLRDYGCCFKAFRRDLAKSISQSGDMQKYAVFFLLWKGCNYSEIEVSDSDRHSGFSKYNFLKLATMLLDVFITFSTQPYMLVTLFLLGVVGCFMGVSVFTALTLNGIITHARLNTNLLMLSLLLIFVGIQFITTAIFNERITRINEKVQEKPLYYVKNITKHGGKAAAAHKK